MPMNPRLLRPSSGAGAAPCPYPASLLLHFDGNFTDSSANGLTVTAVGDAATTAAQSKFGGGSLNPDGGWLTVGSASAFEFGSLDFTVEAWVYPPSGQNASLGTVVTTAYPSDADGIYIGVQDNTSIQWLLGDGTGPVSGWFFSKIVAGVLSANQWNHVALVRKGQTVTLYVNGVNVSQETGFSGSLPNVNEQVLIGGRGDQLFSGYIDDLRITKGLAVYTGPFNPPSAPLSACATTVPSCRDASLLLHFDGNLTDSSANGLTVTAVATAATTGTHSRWGGSSLAVSGSGRVEVADADALDFGTGDFTAECWVYISEYSGGGQCPFAKNGDDDWSAGYGWELSSSSCLFVCGSSTITCPAIAAGQWVHLAAVRKSGVVAIYADGLEIGSGSGSGAIGNAYPLTVGNRLITPQGGWARALNGYIDDLRIVKGLAVYDCAFTPPSAPLSSVCITPEPVSRPASLLLHFDGSLTDSSPNGLTVTANGNATTSTTLSKFGGSSLHLDGDASYLSVSGSNFDFASSDFTVEMWVRRTGESSGAGLVAFAYETNVPFAVSLGDLGSGNKLWAGSYNGAWSWVESDYEVPADTWVHLAAVKSGAVGIIYADGVKVAEAALPATLPSPTSTLYIGQRWDSFSATPHFTGYIDDVRITKRLAVYKGPFTPPTAPLSAIATPQPINASLVLNFDGNFTDESVNGLTVTAIGGASLSTAQAKFGSGSVYFDGSGDYLEVSDEGEFDFGTGDFTIEAWVYPTDASYPNTIVGKRGSGESDLAFVLYVYQASTYLVISSSGTSWALNGGGTATVNNNAWGHVALVRKGSDFSVYWNGVLSQSFSSSSSIFDSSMSLRIGGGGAVNQDLIGYIDGLRITKAALYCDEFTPPTAPAAPTAVPPCCGASEPPPPACDPYGTYLRDECQGWDYGTVYADGECGEYFDAWSPCGCGTLGCTDPSATNYNPDATCDDGSCSYE